MRATPVLTLLLGLLVGGLVGYRLFERETRPRLVRQGESPGTESRPYVDSESRGRDSSGEENAGSRNDSSRPTVHGKGRGEPTASAVLEGKGHLVVDPGRADPDGVDDMYLECRDMRGGEASESLDEGEDGLYRIEAYAGTYALTWREENRTRSMGVRIRAGDSTVVRLPAANDPPPEAPVPAGFGRLEVRLVGADGEPVKYADVWVVGRGITEPEEIKLDAEVDGKAFVELLPGSYDVRIGCFRKTVVVQPGETTRCVCDHAAAGEVRLAPGFPGRVALRAPKNLGEDDTYAIHLWDWRHRTVAFVRPGTYKYALRMDGQSGQYWDAGSVNVAAGRLALIDPPVPSGSFELTVAVPKLPDVMPWTPGGARLLLPVNGKFTVAKVRLRATSTPRVFRGSVERLPPGVWELRIDDASHAKVREKVSIGPGKTSRSIRLEPKR